MINLKYEDEEGLLVELSQYEGGKFVHMDVSRKHAVEGTTGSFEVRYIASCQFLSIGHAQAVARLLVGIEMQPNNAAWKRGPRGVAYPTDAEGTRMVPPDLVEAPAYRNCTHPSWTYTGGRAWCDDCGTEVSP